MSEIWILGSGCALIFRNKLEELVEHDGGLGKTRCAGLLLILC
jgi:hypothetical protein